MSSLEANIESLIFCSPKAIKIGDIKRAFYENEKKEYKENKILNALDNLIEKYKAEEFSFEIVESGGGYQFLTKSKFSRINEILLKQQSKKKTFNICSRNIIHNCLQATCNKI